MKRIIYIILFFAAVTSAMPKDRLAVLPFAGGEDDEGEAIAELFSFTPELNQEFEPVPRTGINRAIEAEQIFQRDLGAANTQNAAALGQELGVKYVACGDITALGNQKLLTILIIDVEELRLITGDIQTYTKIEDIRPKLPDMARAMTEIARLNTSGLPRLALAPVRLTGGGDSGSADTLAHILAIYITKNGKYAVYPRTSSLEQMQSEYEDDRLPVPYENSAPNMTLSVTARKLGTYTMFNAAIIDMTSMVQIAGDSVDYNTLDDGILAMKSLALKLSGINTNYMAGSAEDFSKAVDEINSSGGSGWEYSIVVDGDFAVNGVSFTANAQKTIIISGKTSACALSSNKTSTALFTVQGGVTLILDRNITLRGGGRDSVIMDVRGGTLVMKAGALIRSGGRGGVIVRGGGKFRMEGGSISGNARDSDSGGGGVYVGIGSVFTMEDGIIHDNYAKYGGGVYVSGMGARFTMTGGTITGNNAAYGGGICVSGVGAEFVMAGGLIAKNPARWGSGVYVEGGRFVKTGGGHIETDNSLGEYCVFIFDGGKVRKNAAGPDARLDSLKTGLAGGWE
ncbi:MAG: hypothetical protein LBB22_03425 [Treponema sp.]|jgi:TolB-like protein|nr:hypothetical protein [Treponema sp.]